jgi:hypothetical protein
MYCKCGTPVHPVRLELGYKNCVSCSTTKTCNTIQIVSQEVSASVHKAWRRK